MRKLIIIVAILFTISCKNDVVKIEYTCIEVPILTKENEFELLNYSECFSKIELNLLETNDESLISFVNEIECFHKKLYFLNCQSGIIKIFDMDGGFISSFNRIGNGPQEYRSIKGFDVDLYGNIHVLSYKSIYVYDSLYHFIKKIHIEDLGGASNIEKLQDDNYLIVYNYQYDDKVSHRHAIFNCNTKGYQYFNENIMKTTKRGYINSGYDNQILISPPSYKYDLYAIMEGVINIKYHIDFKELAISPEELDLEKSRILRDKRQVAWPEFKDKAMGISNFWDTPEYIFFEYRVNGSIYNVIHNKSSLMTKTSKYRNNFGKHAPRIIFDAYDTEKNCLIGLIYPHQLKQIEESYLLSRAQIDLLNSVDPNANPILVKYYLK